MNVLLPSLGTDALDGGAVSRSNSKRTIKLANRLIAEKDNHIIIKAIIPNGEKKST